MQNFENPQKISIRNRNLSQKDNFQTFDELMEKFFNYIEVWNQNNTNEETKIYILRLLCFFLKKSFEKNLEDLQVSMFFYLINFRNYRTSLII